MKETRRSSNQQGGYVLLEVLVSVLIFSVGILSLIGMQATATRYATDAQFRSTASYLASQRMSQVWVSANRLGEAGAETIAGLPGGQMSVAVAPQIPNGFLVTVTVNWQMPGDTVPHAHTAVTYINDRCDTPGCV